MRPFEQGEVLTAERLNELVTGATAADEPRAVAGVPRRYMQPPLASFNTDELFACSGEVLPDGPGLIRSIGYSVEDEPYISRGGIVLPMAHDVQFGDDEAVPAAVGVVYTINVDHGLTRPEIRRGQVRLPLAESGCDGSVAGMVSGVAVDAEASEPYICDGVIYLTASGGGGGGDDDCCGGCTCVLAQYNNEAAVDVAGLIASVEADDEAEEMSIVDGAMRLPMADDTLDCGARAGLMASVGQYTEALPTDGCDGWVQAMYLPMQSANGGSQIVSYKQLFRICNGVLQVSAQRCLHPDGNWEEYFSL